MTHTIALIPARAGSKAVRNKNVRNVGGHALMAYSIRAGILCGADRVIVSTDSDSYAEVAKIYGAEFIMRPPEISGDASTDYEFVNHALAEIASAGGVEPELIIHLRPTTPFRSPAIIESAVEALKENDGWTALRSVEKMSESAFKCFTIDGHRLKSIGLSGFNLDFANSQRQIFQDTYSGNGYVDVLRTEFIKRNPGQIHGNSVFPFIANQAIEIDTEEDLDRAQLYALAHPEMVSRLFGK